MLAMIALRWRIGINVQMLCVIVDSMMISRELMCAGVLILACLTSRSSERSSLRTSSSRVSQCTGQLSTDHWSAASRSSCVSWSRLTAE